MYLFSSIAMCKNSLMASFFFFLQNLLMVAKGMKSRKLRMVKLKKVLEREWFKFRMNLICLSLSIAFGPNILMIKKRSK